MSNLGEITLQGGPLPVINGVVRIGVWDLFKDLRKGGVKVASRADLHQDSLILRLRSPPLKVNACDVTPPLRKKSLQQKPAPKTARGRR